MLYPKNVPNWERAGRIILGLVLGVLGIFGRDLVAINPWGLAILGVIFFTSGIGLMKRQV